MTCISCTIGNMAEKRRKLRPGLMLAMEFLVIILTGTLLLALPVSHKEGVDLSLIDAFFVSTSAVCVTGLTPVDISQTLSLFGSTVLMMLVQLGGVGYAIVAVFLIMMTSGKMHMMTSNLIKDSFGADNRTSIRSLIAVVFGCTAFFELAGAALLMIPFSEGHTIPEALYLALFHSVSAFNNAGFDLFSTSLMGWNDNPIVVLTIAFLIIFGGLGFMIYADILSNIRKKMLTVHTKIVLLTTAVLVIAGMLLFHMTIDDISWLNAFFQSVTTRTAGYFSIDQSSLPASAYLLTIVLMFIGASPGSTGGGVKTTSIFTAFMTSFSSILGRKPVVFRREIESESIMKAFFMITLAMLFIMLTTLMLTMAEPDIPFDAILYETISAFATVGLTMGITPQLSSISKIILIIAMFVGRVGLITILASFARSSSGNVNYLGEKIVIG